MHHTPSAWPPGRKRPDGSNYVFPKYVVPARVYVGVKGRDATGAVATDFLSRNGLAYGKVYGFDEVPQMMKDYEDDKVGWFPIFAVND